MSHDPLNMLIRLILFGDSIINRKLKRTVNVWNKRVKAIAHRVHNLSDFFAHWKIKTTSRCVNNVYTLPPKLSSIIKKKGSGLIFCIFRICSKHFEGCFNNSESPNKQMAKSRMAIVKYIHFVSQHKALLRSLHNEFTEIGGLLFNIRL